MKIRIQTVEKWFIRLSWGLLVGSILGWPLSAFTIARNEPKVVLSLSWLAIIISAATMLLESYIKRDLREERDDK